jgi:hypothetical protein
MSDNRIECEIAELRSRWPDEFKDGTRCALLRRCDGDREKGRYPRGFHGWPLDRRSAWCAGLNKGRCDLLRLFEKGAR